MSDVLDHHLGEDLAAMADGGRSLQDARKLELERHVEDCAVCRTAIASAKLVLETVDATRPLEPSKSFDSALFAKLDALDQQSRVSIWDRLRELFTLPKIGVAMAAAAALVLAVVFFEQDRRSPEQFLTADVAQNLEGLAVAEDLDLYRDLELVENLDVLDDLDAINAMDGEAG